MQYLTPFVLDRHWPQGHLSGVQPAVDVVRDARHLCLPCPVVPTRADTPLVPFAVASFSLDHRIDHPPPFAHCITVCRSRKQTIEVRISSSLLARSHDHRRSLSMPGLSSVHHLCTVDQCHASIHTLLWNDRQLPCPRCQSQDIAPWVRPRRPGCKRSWCRSLYRRLSLMAVGIHGHTWAVLRLPSWHDLGAATGR